MVNRKSLVPRNTILMLNKIELLTNKIIQAQQRIEYLGNEQMVMHEKALFALKIASPLSQCLLQTVLLSVQLMYTFSHHFKWTM